MRGTWAGLGFLSALLKVSLYSPVPPLLALSQPPQGSIGFTLRGG